MKPKRKLPGGAAVSDPSEVDRRTGHPFLVGFTVTFCGAAVMVLELLGTRVIGPFYGSSLFVWSALIAVTMIALAGGYFLGGHVADRHPRIHLAHFVWLAALATLSIPLISGPVLRLTNPLGVRVGAFGAALLLFTLPLMALATAGPLAIKRWVLTATGVGTAAGSIYAISTLGSVAATVLLGFFLLPTFGSRSVLLGLSAALSVLAACLIWFDRSAERPPIGGTSVLPLAILTSGIAASLLFSPPTRQVEGFDLVDEAESVYGWVRVVDDRRNGFRLLLSDASVLSAVDAKTGQTLLGYQSIIGLMPLFRPEAKTALLVGLGGGHVAQILHRQGLQTDTIEIDPAVADAAVKHFGFVSHGAFLVGDARYEIRKLSGSYDLIVHDCFTGGAEPTHLLTREMLMELRGLLNERGVLALNYVGFRQGEGANAVASVHATLRAVFPNVRVFMTEPSELTDFVFVASQEPLPLDQAASDRRAEWLRAHETGSPDGEGIILTDDFNPIEAMQVRKAEVYREKFVERVAFDLLLR